MKYQKEVDCGFWEFLIYMENHDDGEFTFIFDKSKVNAKYDTIYEDENDLPDDDSNYDEYNTILFKIEDRRYIEINYLNMPNEIYHNGALIFKKVNGKLIKV